MITSIILCSSFASDGPGSTTLMLPARIESGEREREREHREREGEGARERLGAIGWALPQLVTSSGSGGKPGCIVNIL